MEKIRFAVIGRGFITERFLAHAALCPRFELTAVCSRRADTARDFAAAVQAEREAVRCCSAGRSKQCPRRTPSLVIAGAEVGRC